MEIFLDYIFLHTMPGYCYLNPGWDISILPPNPLLRLCQCHPTLPNYFFYDNNNKTSAQ